ncbi:MAG: NUDIX hydrolase [Clostridia bacterium]|nr:NUDIX hydrolase [Clostridia bacterium]
MDFTEKTIKKDYKFNGEVISLRVDTVTTPSGNTATREIVEHPGGVCVVPLDKDGNVIMEWQYRRPFDMNVFEIPAGKLYKGEDPLECGKRELEEETGMCANTYIYLGKMLPTPGFCGEILHMYLALDLYEGKINRDEDEFMEIVRVPLSELVDKVLSGEIIDGKTALALMKVNEMKNRGLI